MMLYALSILMFKSISLHPLTTKNPSTSKKQVNLWNNRPKKEFLMEKELELMRRHLIQAVRHHKLYNKNNMTQESTEFTEV